MGMTIVSFWTRSRESILLIAVVLCLLWLAWLGVTRSGYHWQWYRVPRYLFTVTEHGITAGPLLLGLLVTIRLAAVSLVLAFGFGLVAALLLVSDSLIGRMLSRAYVECVRNTPLLVQLFFLYFILAPVLGLDRFWSAVLALSLFEGAYAAEIIRAGIVSVERGQWEAAFSLGLSIRQTCLRIILPQALYRVVPPLAGLAVSLVKDSALVSAIAVAELAWRAQVLVAETLLSFELWFTVALLYLLLTLTLAGCSLLLERLLAEH